MSDNYTNYDNEERTFGFFESDSPMWCTVIIMGIVTTIVGVLFGVGAMIKCAFACALIIGGLCLLAMGIYKLNEIISIWTKGHSKIVWTVLGIIFVIIAVSACHNELVDLLS